MKKILTTALVLAISVGVNAQTQIGNSGFENWESVSEGQEPVNWSSFKTASGGQANFGAVQIERSTDVRTGAGGQYSALITSRNVIFGIIAQGNMTTGQINMGSTSASNAENHNRTRRADPKFSEAIQSRPDSIVFWVKFNPSNGSANHTARVKAALHGDYDYKDPEDNASSAQLVASAELNYPKTNNVWVRKSIPFVYTGNGVQPRYMLITFATNNIPAGGSADDKVWIDDLELIYNKPVITRSATSICAGSTITYAKTLTGPGASQLTNFFWSFPGGSPATSTSANPTVTYATAGSYNVALSVVNGLDTMVTTMPNFAVVNPVPNATFNYSAPTYCSNVNNPTPTAVSPGTFTSTPAGLVFANTTTGEINLAQSTAGTYTITKTTNGSCSTTSTKTVTIFTGLDASFNYPTSTICILEGNQTPTVTETGGVFSSNPTSGLVFASATTGEIAVDQSTAGTYAITYIRSGACADTVTKNVTLTSTPIATFNYSNPSFCLNAANQSPIFSTGASAGVFTAGAGLDINANSGLISLGTSTPGTYTVVNNIAAIGACPSATHNATVVINEIPTVSFELANDTVCTSHSAFLLTGGLPTGGQYSGTGIAANLVNPTAFAPGTEILITYTYTNTATQCSNTATDILTIDGCLSIDDQEFSTISIYPNPTTGFLTIDNITTDATYTVFGLTGQIVAKGQLAINTNTIDLTTVQNGIYLVEIKQGLNIQTVRIVKQ